MNTDKMDADDTEGTDIDAKLTQFIYIYIYINIRELMLETNIRMILTSPGGSFTAGTFSST